MAKSDLVLIALFPLVTFGLLNGLYLAELGAGSLLFWVSDILFFVLLPIILLLILYRHGVEPREYGLRTLGNWQTIWEKLGVFLFVAFLFFLAYEPVSVIAYHFLWRYAQASFYAEAIPSNGVARVVVVLYLSATAAFVEEIVYRGLPWLYVTLKHPKNPPVGLYLLVTATLFALIHWEQGPHGLVATFMLGFVAAAIYTQIRNLWPFITGHFVTDVYNFW